MKIRITAAVLSGILLAPAFMAAPVSANATCVPGAQVRDMVGAFVANIKDDVRSDRARAATRLALVEGLRTFRGARADTPEERQGLGKEISALATQLNEAENRVERKALIALILELTEQRRHNGGFTTEERQEVRAALASLGRAIVNRADSAAEGRELSMDIREIVQAFPCKPA